MLPSPSALGRVAACVRSETLERVEDVTEPAALGSIAHDYLSNINLKGADEAMQLAAPHDREWLRGFDLLRLSDLLDPRKYASEVSFAYDPRTGKARELGRNLTRAEARAKALPGELVGTADLVGEMVDGMVLLDFKTGFGWVDPPSINWQVLTYLLMACRAYGKDGGVVGIVRARADGTVWTDTFTVDLFRLEQHEVELRALLEHRERVLAAATAGEALPAFVEGPHCKYCPARRICPPKTAQLLAMAATLAPAVDEEGRPVEMTRLGAPLSDETASMLWDRVEFVEKMAERLRAELKEWARRSPIPRGGGWVIEECQKTRETIVAELAVPVLEVELGKELAATVTGSAIERTQEMTKEALATALKKFVLPSMGPKATITKLKEDVLQRLREGGAMSVKAWKTVEEHKVKPPAKGKALESGPTESEEAA